MSKSDREIVFCIAPASEQSDGVAVLLFGVPKAAWEYMKDGHTHTFDLTRARLPLKVLIYGAEDHAGAMKPIEEHMRKIGKPFADERGTDFSIKPKQGG